MRLILSLARAHPRRSLLTLTCLVLAGLAEGVGLGSLLPLLDLATSQTSGATPSGSPLSEAVRQFFLRAGLEPTLGFLLFLVVGGMVGKAALMLLANRQVGYAVSSTATELRLDLVRSLLSARWAYYTRQPVGVIANAFATEAERASQAYLHGTLVVAAGLQAILYASIALLVSWQATLAALGVGLFSTSVLGGLVGSAKRAGKRQTLLLRSSLARLADGLQAVKPLRAMARESLIGPLLEKETHRLDRAMRGEVLSKEGLRSLQEPIVVAALAGGLYVAMTYLGFALSSLLMLGLLFTRTLSVVNKGQKQYQSLVVRESAYHSVHETIDRARAHAEVAGGQPSPPLKRDVTLDGVSLSYGAEPVLHDVSLRLPAGQITALIGPSGAGKTSIADLVIGLVRPNRGEVHVDGVPLGEIDLLSWRRQIGYVPQEMFLLHDTVLANVSLGDPDLCEADVESALRAARALEFVQGLPEGVHTTVGERGSLLSGGQRQRIAIARALVHRPRLLVLDEATTALDPETESAVCDAVDALRGEITVLAISHQRALVDLADQVVRIENGTAKQVHGAAGSNPA